MVIPMAKSMTGFGRSQQTIDNFDISVEIKSVNHRYADFNLRVPRHYAFLEEPVKARLKASISRGKADVYVSVHKQLDDSKQITLNTALAKSYIDAAEQLAQDFGLENDVTVSTMTRFADIFDVTHKEDDESELLARVLAVTDAAALEFSDMRAREGEKLAADMLMRNALVRDDLAKIEEIAPQTVAEYREKLELRIRDLLGDAKADEGRLLTEVAIFADKLSVTEEIIRLKSHLGEFERIMAQPDAIGRKLDFLLQEMNREVNTIGSKSNNLDIARIVVNMKAELEKIREQLQNIE